MVSGSHKGLPDLPLLALAIAQQSVDSGVLALDLGTESHTNGDRAALTQRAGGGVYAGYLLAVGMALQDGVKLAEISELIPTNESHLSKDAVVAGGGVAFAQYEPIPIRGIRILGIYAHMVIKYACQQFDS